jgi:hypothetical protein
MSDKPDYCVLCSQSVDFKCPTCGNDVFSKYRSQRPFQSYVDQPDTTERVRLAVQTIPWAMPEKKGK